MTILLLRRAFLREVGFPLYYLREPLVRQQCPILVGVVFEGSRRVSIRHRPAGYVVGDVQ